MTEQNIPGWLNTEDGGSRGIPFPNGEHEVSITRLILTGEGDMPRVNRRGIPEIVFIFADGKGHEAAYYTAVTDEPLEQGERSLGRVIAGCQMDTDKMKAKGLTTKHFEPVNADFLNKVFIGVPRKLRINVSRNVSKTTGKEYTNINILLPGQASPQPVASKIAEQKADEEAAY